jgi:hypothetical protein
MGLIDSSLCIEQRLLDGTLSIVDQILVVSLIASMPINRQSFTLEELFACNMAPSESFCLKVVQQLSENDLLAVVKSSGSEEVYKLNVQNSDSSLKLLLKSLSGASFEQSEGVMSLVFDVLASECIQLITELLSADGVNLEESCDVPEKIDRLLCCRPLSEVLMLLWMAIQKLSMHEIRVMSALGSDGKCVEKIVEGAFTLHNEYKHKTRKIKKFRRAASYDISCISNILFKKRW